MLELIVLVLALLLVGRMSIQRHVHVWRQLECAQPEHMQQNRQKAFYIQGCSSLESSWERISPTQWTWAIQK